MNKFIEDVYTFNKLGMCSKDQSYKNLIGGLHLVKEEVQEAEDALFEFLKNNEEWSADNRADLMDAGVDAMVTIVGLLYRSGFNRQQIEFSMSVVSEANLNKYCVNEHDADKSVEQYEKDERYSNVHWEKTTVEGKVYYAIIGTTEEGTRKILKGISWVDPKKMIKQVCR